MLLTDCGCPSKGPTRAETQPVHPIGKLGQDAFAKKRESLFLACKKIPFEMIVTLNGEDIGSNEGTARAAQ